MSKLLSILFLLLIVDTGAIEPFPFEPIELIPLEPESLISNESFSIRPEISKIKGELNDKTSCKIG